MAKCENCHTEKAEIKTSTVYISRKLSAGFPKCLCQQCFEWMQTMVEGDYWLGKGEWHWDK